VPANYLDSSLSWGNWNVWDAKSYHEVRLMPSVLGNGTVLLTPFSKGFRRKPLKQKEPPSMCVLLCSWTQPAALQLAWCLPTTWPGTTLHRCQSCCRYCAKASSHPSRPILPTRFLALSRRAMCEMLLFICASATAACSSWHLPIVYTGVQRWCLTACCDGMQPATIDALNSVALTLNFFYATAGFQEGSPLTFNVTGYDAIGNQVRNFFNSKFMMG
jgi:hypothetical protein